MTKFHWRQLGLAAAALVLVGCSVPAIRFATPAETAAADRPVVAASAVPAPAATATPPANAPSPSTTPAPTPAASPGSSGALSQFQDTLNGIAAAAQASIVQVDTGSGLGSGIVLDTAGNIVTNAHVVAGATSLSIKTSDGHTFSATLVGSYSQNDLAVVKATGATGLKPATFADSSLVNTGDIVLAVGSPFGLTDTVTEGIVSAVGRTESEQNGTTLSDLIQTSAPINPGNSGGALVNIKGEVIGMPTLSGSDRQGSQPSTGIGFAIPSNQIVSYSKQLVATGTVTHTDRAYLGVSTSDDPTSGARLNSVVSGGPADKAGIKSGWTITDLGGRAVADSSVLTQVLTGYHPGTSVSVTLRLPDGSSRTVNVTLGERPVSP